MSIIAAAAASVYPLNKNPDGAEMLQDWIDDDIESWEQAGSEAFAAGARLHDNPHYLLGALPSRGKCSPAWRARADAWTRGWMQANQRAGRGSVIDLIAEL